jgi:hypothetical protein
MGWVNRIWEMFTLIGELQCEGLPEGWVHRDCNFELPIAMRIRHHYRGVPS